MVEANDQGGAHSKKPDPSQSSDGQVNRPPGIQDDCSNATESKGAPSPPEAELSSIASADHSIKDTTLSSPEVQHHKGTSLFREAEKLIEDFMDRTSTKYIKSRPIAIGLIAFVMVFSTLVNIIPAAYSFLEFVWPWRNRNSDPMVEIVSKVVGLDEAQRAEFYSPETDGLPNMLDITHDPAVFTGIAHGGTVFNQSNFQNKNYVIVPFFVSSCMDVMIREALMLRAILAEYLANEPTLLVYIMVDETDTLDEIEKRIEASGLLNVDNTLLVRPYNNRELARSLKISFRKVAGSSPTVYDHTTITYFVSKMAEDTFFNLFDSEPVVAASIVVNFLRRDPLEINERMLSVISLLQSGWWSTSTVLPARNPLDHPLPTASEILQNSTEITNGISSLNVEGSNCFSFGKPENP